MMALESRFARWTFWALIAATAIGRFAVAFADHRSLIANDIFQDDAFYYLKIAENVVAGRGFTFDGQTPTSGFQPLFQFVLIPLVWSIRPSLVAPIRASALLLAGLAVLTGFLVFRLARRVGGTTAGLASLAFWALSPLFVFFGVNGQETGLAILLSVAALLVWLRLREHPEPGRRMVIGMGLLCGLGLLARLDSAVLFLAMGLEWSLSRLVRREKIAPARATATVALVAGLVWGAWMLASRALTGDWLPQSGPASRQIALSYGWLNLPHVWSSGAAISGDPSGSPYFDLGAVPFAYRADVVARAVLVLLFDHPLLAALRLGVPFTAWPQLSTYFPSRVFQAVPILTSLVLLAALTALAMLARRAVRGSGSQSHSLAPFGRIVAAYGVMQVLMYVWYCPVHWYFSRYFTTVALLTTILAVGLLAKLAALPRRAWARALLLGGLVVLPALQLPNWRFLDRLQWRDAPSGGFLASWEALRPAVPAPARVGAFQAGIIGWFSGRDVVNLDGKVNRDAFRAIEDRRLHEYIEDQRIEYVIDWDWIIWALCARHAPKENMARWELVRREDGGAKLSLYRVRGASD